MLSAETSHWPGSGGLLLLDRRGSTVGTYRMAPEEGSFALACGGGERFGTGRRAGRVSQTRLGAWVPGCLGAWVPG